MKGASRNILLFLIFIFLTLSASACGIRYCVKGQVIDEKTGEPIEGAVVAIKWYKHTIFGFFPGSDNTSEIERAEDVTDKNGIFRIPKRPFREHDMGVYKQNYICWRSSGELTFEKKPGYEPSYIKKGVDIGLYYRDKTGHIVEEGMVVKLESFKEKMTDMQRRQIACFASNVELRSTW